jgi:hypothetical protein
MRSLLVVALPLLLAAPGLAEKTDPPAKAGFVKGDKHPTFQLQVGDIPLGIEARAQARIRSELTGPADLGGGTPSFFTVQRVRVGTTMAFGDSLAIVADVQDVRVWGEETPLPGKPGDPTLFGFDSAGLDLHQAYLRTKLGPVDLRVGRQELILDSHRLIGNVDWLMQGRAFDAVRAWYGRDAHQMTVFAAMVRDGASSTPPAAGDVAIGGVHYAWQPSDTFSFAPLLLVDGRTEPGLLRWTSGARAHGKSGSFNYDLEGYYQGAGQDVGVTTAALFGARGGWTAKGAFKPHIGLFADFVSGDSDTTSPQGLSSFDTLFGTNHKFYGLQDLFLNLPVHTAGRGLTDVGINLKISEGMFWAKLDMHAMAAADFKADPLFGVEPDLTVGVKANRVKLQSGVSFFIPVGPGLGRGNTVTPWGYVLLTGWI